MPYPRRHHYLLTKLSLLVCVFILLLTSVMAVLNYQSSVHLRLDSYRQMLQTLDTTYLQELVEESERQLSVLGEGLDPIALMQGGTAKNSTWQVAHQIKNEAHYIYFYHAGSGKIESYPDWTPPADFNASERPWYPLLKNPGEQAGWIGPYAEIGSGQQVLTLGKPIRGPGGELLGLLLVDMSLESIANTLERVMGDQVAALYLRQRNGPVIAEVNPQWLARGSPIDETQLGHIGLGLTCKGVLLHRELAYADWELGLYLPPQLFRNTLLKELALVLLPLGAISLVAWFGIRSLLRIVRQELRLVERGLSQLGHEEEFAYRPGQLNAWFVDKSLTELASIEQQYNQHRVDLRLAPLTGIFNRRAFDEDFARMAGENSEFALVLIDVDHFKQVNDSFGHGFGDLVLRRIADLMVSVLGFDAVYRIGGDEFAALLPLDRTTLIERLERLNIHMRRQRWREDECRVTLSQGAVLGPGKDLFRRADEALYRCKDAGRDGWKIAGE